MTDNVPGSFYSRTGIAPSVTIDVNSQLEQAAAISAEVNGKVQEVQTALNAVDEKIATVQTTSDQMAADAADVLANTTAAIDGYANTAMANIISTATASAQNASANATAGVTNTASQVIETITSTKDSAVTAITTAKDSAIASVSNSSSSVIAATNSGIAQVNTARDEAIALVSASTNPAVVTALGYTPANKAGETFTGQVAVSQKLTISRVGQGGDPALFVDGGSGTAKRVGLLTDGKLRWVLGSNNGVESGSNTGSNFYLQRYDDAGDVIDVPMAVQRATGAITFNSTPSVNGSSLWHSGNQAAPDARYLKLSGGTLTGALTLTGSPTASLHAATKGYVDSATDLLLPKAGGTIAGGLTVNNALNVGGTIASSSDGTFYRSGTPSTGAINFGSSGQRYLYSDGTTISTNGNFVATGNISAPSIVANSGNVSATGSVSGSYLYSSGNIDAAGNIGTSNTISCGTVNAGGNMTAGNVITGGRFLCSTIEYAYQQNTAFNDGQNNYYSQFGGGDMVGYNYRLFGRHITGVNAGFIIQTAGHGWFFDNAGNATTDGTWINGSDSRVKEDKIQISGALDKVVTLSGYTYKRVDLPQIDGSFRREAGLLAQDVRGVLPEAVFVGDKAPVTDPDGEGFLSLNYNAVTALLVEAVKELVAKNAALEARVAGLEG
ncbi:tail fiber domain-containing protein [Roseomonas chloroacetimidivorans]|uniref:tail fiber domain-containing protein n=1 Tax=Roseomonas chloroacetimidivorans TaxID=1766656 RepID=UPI003C75BB86